MCSISREPRREECTICTAVAPDAVFTVRRYGDTGQAYGPGLVRKFPHRKPRTRRSQRHARHELMIVSQVRYAVAAGGERLPRKSTSFAPKPRTGLILRSFAAG
jgi:hypothetical protein